MILFINSTLFALLGIAVGFFVLPVSERVIEYKCRAKNQPMKKCWWFSGDRYVCMSVLGAIFFASFYYFDFLQALVICTLGSLAVSGTLIDYQIRIIPNEYILVIFALGFLFNLTEGGFIQVLFSLGTGLFTFLVFLLAAWITRFLVKKIGVGAGDIKLAAAAAFAVGWPRINWFFGGIVVFLTVYIVFGLYFKRIQLNSYFPMGGQIYGGFIGAYLIPHLLSLLG